MTENSNKNNQSVTIAWTIGIIATLVPSMITGINALHTNHLTQERFKHEKELEMQKFNQELQLKELELNNRLSEKILNNCFIEGQIFADYLAIVSEGTDKKKWQEVSEYLQIHINKSSCIRIEN